MDGGSAAITNNSIYDNTVGIRVKNGGTITALSGNSFDAGCCGADYDHNGSVAVADIFAMLNAWFGSSRFVDANGSGAIEVADIFAFTNAWMAGDMRTDYNGSGGLTVQDVFDYLNAWFAGC